AGCGEDFSVKIHFEDLAGETVDHEDGLLSDVEAARQTGVLQFLDEFSVRVKELDPLVFTIRDPELPLGIEGKTVRDVELTGLFPFTTPRLDELASLIELQNARVSPLPGRVALSNKDVAVAADDDVIGLVELVGLRRFIPRARLPLR